MQQNDYKKLKGLAKHINHLINTGKWNTLAKRQQTALKSALMRLLGRVQRFVTKRKLAHTLGAAVALISTNAVAQTFADPVLNPFEMDDVTYYAKPEFVDLDGDGDLDFFHSNVDDGFFVYQENTGTPESPAFGPSIGNPFGLAPTDYSFTPIFGDIDNDGDFDLLTTKYEDGSINYFENIGTATDPEFAAETELPFGTIIAYSFPNDLIDIDNDGDLDLFMTSYDYAGDGNVRLHFYENTGSPESVNFADPVVDPFGVDFSTEDYYIFVDFADIDSDGDFDFMRTEMYGQIVYFHENIGTADSPAFASGTGEASPFDIDPLVGYNYFFAPTLADIDADGDFDLFVSEYEGYGTFFFENLGIIDDASIAGSNLLIDQISLFPNPTREFISLNTELTNEEIQSIQIMTADGRQVYQSNVLTKDIDVKDYPAGIYIVAIKQHDGQLGHLKFVKE